MRPGVIRSVCSAQETGRELVLLRISGKLLRLEEPMCSTTNTAAFKSDGKLEMIRSSAATPPCDAPMTMMLSFNHLSAVPFICGVGLIAIEIDVRACSNETRGAPAGMQFSVALAPTAALDVYGL